ncbi:MAG: aromatic-ring-hydroxylating dioxygenase beta subunit [Rhodospirillales bacterium]|nr:aromatic-ring-hydroxylating dioxygenase beta subunit [Rhodospirillales bacterium]
MGTEDISGRTAERADRGMNRRGVVGTLTKGAVAGTLLAGLASTAMAEPLKKTSADAPAHEQIRNLLAMYSFLLDAADYAKWGQLFGEKGTLELNGAVWAQGAEGVAKKMAEVMAASSKPITGVTGEHMYRHIYTNTHIAVNEVAGTAEADSYFFVLHIDRGSPPSIGGGGRYSDKFARLNGEWRFTAKRMDFDWSDA